MEPIKSIAVPVGRKRSAGKPRRPGLSTPSADGAVGGPAGLGRREHKAIAPGQGHKFHVGERVLMKGGGRVWARQETMCKVVALLPDEGGPLRYRVRGETETFERVIEEIDLDMPRDSQPVA